MTTRRIFLQWLTSAPLLAAAGGHAHSREASRMASLIQQAQTYEGISRRIDFISRGLLGVRYQANTLIGGPRRQELFVARHDAFDCVTFCEAVLAAALANDLREFEASLRRIRYEHGEVRWDQRNHDFAKWSRRVVENKICQPVKLNPSVPLEKVLTGDELGKRRFAFVGIPTPTLLANRGALHAGDIIGFVSRRPELDFFHTGFVTFGKGSSLLLRHASQSRGRVVDEDMNAFIASNGVKWVTLLRAEEPAPAAT